MRHLHNFCVLGLMFVPGCGDLLCGDFFCDLSESQRPTQQCLRIPDLKLTIDSYPASDPVVADIEVIGTLSGESTSAVSQIRIGVVKATETPSTPVSTSPVAVLAASIWTATVPIELLLSPNSGPGAVRIEAVTVDECNMSMFDRSEPFDVDYPPSTP